MLRARGMQRGREKGESGKYGVPLHRIQVVIRAMHFMPGSLSCIFATRIQRIQPLIRDLARDAVAKLASSSARPEDRREQRRLPFFLPIRRDSKRKVPVRVRRHMEIPPRNDEPRPEGALGIARRHR